MNAQYSLPHFCVVVPCYNEENGVDITLRKIAHVAADGEPFEIIAVNDGSTDRTGSVLRSLAGQIPQLRILEHHNNRGYGAALKTGICNAVGDIIIIIDADNSYPAEQIPVLVARCKNCDMVIGVRTYVAYSRIRRILKSFFRCWVSWISKRAASDINSGMRAFRRQKIIPFLDLLPMGFSFTTTTTLIFLTTRLQVEFHPIAYSSRIGSSKVRGWRDISHAFANIFRICMHLAPLRNTMFILMFLGGFGGSIYACVSLIRIILLRSFE